jgi:hypothetical protein
MDVMNLIGEDELSDAAFDPAVVWVFNGPEFDALVEELLGPAEPIAPTLPAADR